MQFVARGLNLALGVLAVVVLARALGPSGFGVWTTALAFVGVFGILADFGLARIATQRMSAEPEKESDWLGALFGTVTAASVLALAVTVAGIPLLSDEGDARLVTLILAFTLLGVGPGAVAAVFDSRVRAEFRMIILSLNSAAWLGLLFVLDAGDASIVAFAIGFLIINLLTGALGFLVSRRHARISVRRGRALWRPLLRVALPVGIAAGLVVLYYRIDAVLVFNISGSEEAGIYGAAYRFLDPLIFIPTAVVGALFPVVAALHGRDPKRVRELVQHGGEYLVIAALGALGVTIPLSEPIVDLLLGPEFDRTAGLLPILMLGFVFVSLSYLAGSLVPVVGLQWRFVAYAAVGVGVNVALNLALIPPYGAYGAAWATVVTEVVVSGLTLAAVFSALRFSPEVGRVLRATLAAAAMTGAVALAARLGLVPALLVAAPTYLGCLVALRVIVPAEVRELFGTAAAVKGDPGRS
ncbi:MAG: flippase [Solirubrobacterales bacterium]